MLHWTDRGLSYWAVTDADPAALRHWQYEVGRSGGLGSVPDWTPPSYQPWRLRRRTVVNRGGPGAEAFDLELQLDRPDDPIGAWLPGPLTVAGSGPQPKVPRPSLMAPPPPPPHYPGWGR